MLMHLKVTPGIFYTRQNVDRLDRLKTPMLTNDQLTIEAHLLDVCACSVDVQTVE